MVRVCFEAFFVSELLVNLVLKLHQVSQEHLIFLVNHFAKSVDFFEVYSVGLILIILVEVTVKLVTDLTKVQTLLLAGIRCLLELFGELEKISVDFVVLAGELLESFHVTAEASLLGVQVGKSAISQRAHFAGNFEDLGFLGADAISHRRVQIFALVLARQNLLLNSSNLLFQNLEVAVELVGLKLSKRRGCGFGGEFSLELLNFDGVRGTFAVNVKKKNFELVDLSVIVGGLSLNVPDVVSDLLVYFSLFELLAPVRVLGLHEGSLVNLATSLNVDSQILNVASDYSVSLDFNFVGFVSQVEKSVLKTNQLVLQGVNDLVFLAKLLVVLFLALVKLDAQLVTLGFGAVVDLNELVVETLQKLQSLQDVRLDLEVMFLHVSDVVAQVLDLLNQEFFQPLRVVGFLGVSSHFTFNVNHILLRSHFNGGHLLHGSFGLRFWLELGLRLRLGWGSFRRSTGVLSFGRCSLLLFELGLRGGGLGLRWCGNSRGTACFGPGGSGTACSGGLRSDLLLLGGQNFLSDFESDVDARFFVVVQAHLAVVLVVVLVLEQCDPLVVGVETSVEHDVLGDGHTADDFCVSSDCLGQNNDFVLRNLSGKGHLY